MQYDSICEMIIPLIKEAGNIMLCAHDPESADSVSSKPGTVNFVTIYDVRVQEFLITEIKKSIPDAYFIAEEQANEPSALNHRHCFIIDPIDGTTNFIHDYKMSSISVAMLSFGKVVFGAVYNPYLNELFHAEKGRGAFLNDSPIHVSSRPAKLAITTMGTSPYYKDRFAKKTFDLAHELFLKGADIRRSGSAAIDLAYVAAGRTDAFYEFLLSPWDIAAGYLLVKEAGGCVSDMQGKDFDFISPASLFAANSVIYRDFLEITRQY